MVLHLQYPIKVLSLGKVALLGNTSFWSISKLVVLILNSLCSQSFLSCNSFKILWESSMRWIMVLWACVRLFLSLKSWASGGSERFSWTTGLSVFRCLLLVRIEGGQKTLHFWVKTFHSPNIFFRPIQNFNLHGRDDILQSGIDPDCVLLSFMEFWFGFAEFDF